MSGYFVLQVEWNSPPARETYVERLGSMIEQHGGEFPIASRNYRVVEGSWKPGMFIVIKFPSMAR